MASETSGTDRFPEALYDQVADWYAKWVADESWAHTTLRHHLAEMTGPVGGAHVLDVACGEGVFTADLARAGATATGVDLSAAMLAHARNRAASSGLPLRLLRDDAHALANLADEQFDGAICMLALMDMPGLGAVYRAVARRVRAGGWFVIAISHPCFDGPHACWADRGDVRDRVTRTYLTEGHWVSDFPHGVRGRVGAHHRTISTYLNAAREAGWWLEQMLEPVSRTHEGDIVTAGAEIPRLLMARFTQVKAPQPGLSPPPSRRRPT